MAFHPIDSILDFLEPVNKYLLSDQEGYKHNQLGNNIEAYEVYFPPLRKTDMVIVGCGETRGAPILAQVCGHALRRCVLVPR